jgi:thiol-disulfide isomerase/thioredoxin
MDEGDNRPARATGAPRGVGAAIAITVAVVALGLGGAKAWDAWVREPRARAADDASFGVDRTDVPAPAIELATLDGRRVSLAALRGQVVFVNFWATWCPPCRAEMPSMLTLGRELEQRYPGKFRMLAVSVDDGWQPVLEYFGGPPPPGLTVALDTDQLVTRAYYCAARHGCPDSYKFPETYVVDASGRLVAYVVGPREWSAPAARRFLERLLGS